MIDYIFERASVEREDFSLRGGTKEGLIAIGFCYFIFFSILGMILLFEYVGDSSLGLDSVFMLMLPIYELDYYKRRRLLVNPPIKLLWLKLGCELLFLLFVY